MIGLFSVIFFLRSTVRRNLQDGSTKQTDASIVPHFGMTVRGITKAFPLRSGLVNINLYNELAS